SCGAFAAGFRTRARLARDALGQLRSGFLGQESRHGAGSAARGTRLRGGAGYGGPDPAGWSGGPVLPGARLARANCDCAREPGSGGVQNPALPATILTIGGAGPSFAAAANLTQPIFDHGKLRAQRDETLARERELLAAYRAAVIAALVDVEKALSALEHLRAVEEFQRGNVNESERAFEGARVRYERGSGDFLTLLELERTLYAARDQFTQYKLARLQG